jgi:hypothetical protein
MTLIDAIAKAKEIGGGKVVRDDLMYCYVHDDGSFEALLPKGVYNCDDYAVTPLSPDEQEATLKQPEPKEPELMTGADAMAMVIKNGGEVWHSKLNSPRVSYDASGNLLTNSHWAIDLGPDKIYTVRPLPPVLLPCPFCGGDARFVAFTKAYQCERCYAMGPSVTGDTNKEKAIAAWNRREGCKS